MWFDVHGKFCDIPSLDLLNKATLTIDTLKHYFFPDNITS